MSQALPLTTRIRQGAKRAVKQRIRDIQYGNGYREVALDGVITTYEEWSGMGWDALTSSEQTTVYTFLNAVGEWDYVTYQPPGASSAKRYRIIGGWEEEWISGNLVNITFTLRQE